MDEEEGDTGPQTAPNEHTDMARVRLPYFRQCRPPRLRNARIVFMPASMQAGGKKHTNMPRGMVFASVKRFLQGVKSRREVKWATNLDFVYILSGGITEEGMVSDRRTEGRVQRCHHHDLIPTSI